MPNNNDMDNTNNRKIKTDPLAFKKAARPALFTVDRNGREHGVLVMGLVGNNSKTAKLKFWPGT